MIIILFLCILCLRRLGDATITQIQIVNFGYIGINKHLNDKMDWVWLVEMQLTDLIHTGILDHSMVHLHIVTANRASNNTDLSVIDRFDILKDLCEQLLTVYHGKYSFKAYLTNLNEYPG